MTKPFAYFPGEDPEQTEVYIEGLKTDLRGRIDRGDPTEDVDRELERFGVKPEKRTGRQSRPRVAAEKRGE